MTAGSLKIRTVIRSVVHSESWLPDVSTLTVPTARLELSAPPRPPADLPAGLTAPTPADERVAVVIPAHDEQDALATAVASVRAQSRPVDRILVVSDNSTDGTVELAARLGVEVLETRGNTAKKAGALNQALRQRFRRGGPAPHATWPEPERRAPGSPESDACTGVLFMDADGTINQPFVERALAVLRDQPDVGGVGGVFWGRDGGGLLGLLQRMEYARYARQVARRQGKATVLTGTGTLFRAAALAEVARARADRRLPGPGTVYAERALTEDNELTLAVKSLGWACVSPKECVVTTDVMTTVRGLFHQRVRWYRGAVEDLAAYGLTRTTLPYVAQQLRLALSISVFHLFLTATVLQVAVHGHWGLQPWWLLASVVFAAEQVVSARRVSWRGAVLAAALVPVMLYDLLLQGFYLTGWWRALRGARAEWVAT